MKLDPIAALPRELIILIFGIIDLRDIPHVARVSKVSLVYLPIHILEVV